MCSKICGYDLPTMQELQSFTMQKLFQISFWLSELWLSLGQHLSTAAENPHPRSKRLDPHRAHQWLFKMLPPARVKFHTTRSLQPTLPDFQQNRRALYQPLRHQILLILFHVCQREEKRWMRFWLINSSTQMKRKQSTTRHYWQEAANKRVWRKNLDERRGAV